MRSDNDLETGYYSNERRVVLPYLPDTVSRLLEVGCGDGTTIRLVKSARTVTWAGGVELNAEMATRAATVCDRVWSIDVERDIFERDIEPGSLDLVLCLDVLEHLANPWDAVCRFSDLLRPGGRMIISVPNIRQLKFIMRLLFKGDFQYKPHGLLDRTHLRFFVSTTAVDLVKSGGLHVIADHSAQTYKTSDLRHWLVRLTGGHMNVLLAKQWIVVGEKR
jgi:2-polyprenyl-3-methyl-5-hydroxy-6-metoxy-1,4-benzoquinol methylase